MLLTGYKINTRTHLLGALLILVALGFQGCKSTIWDSRPDQGLILFDVTYPYLEKTGIMAAMLPNTMEMRFRDNQYVSDLQAGMGLFRMGFISSNETMELKNFLKVGGEKMAVQLGADETKKYLLDFPEVTIIFTDGIDTIAGFPCKQAIAIYNDASKPDMTLYYTDKIKMTRPNWCNQFYEIDGVLLAYEVDRYNIRMRFRAKSFTEEMPEDDVFAIPADFDMVSATILEKKIQETMGTFDF